MPNDLRLMEKHLCVVLFPQPHVWLYIHIACVCVVQRYPVVMSTYLGIMGRVLLQNSSFFSSLLTQMASECSQKVRLRCLSFLSSQHSLFECLWHKCKVPVKRESFWTRLNVMSQGIANGNILKFRVAPLHCETLTWLFLSDPEQNWFCLVLTLLPWSK